jgi:hypothetical protein
MHRRPLTFAIFLIAFAILSGFVWTTPAAADNLYASIRGIVTDPSGAVVPGVKLTATNVATGVSYTTTSNRDGAYNFLQLAIGSYSVKAEVTGFKSFQTTGVKLDLNEVFSLNVKLEVGTVSQELVVEANPVQVETTDMQLGTTITGNQIVDLPLNGRDWTNLQQLQPGVVGSSDRFGGGSGGNGGYSGNGAETQQNSFLINGTDSNDGALNTAMVIPSPDAIGEFRMVSNTINPEYGRNSGTIVNAVIKNGTNQFHGDVFEFYRDTFLDAKSWFELQPSTFHQNQFGGTIGGPIIKNHAFFFFSYQGLRATQPEAFPGGIQPTVFSAAERTGNFSAFTNGGPFPLTNSAGKTLTSPFPLVGSNGTTYPAGTPYATIFSNGVIPTADLNPLAVKVMNQYVPLPNGPGNLYLFNPSINNKDDQYIYRIDEKLREQDSIWFYGLYENNPATDALPFNVTNLPGFGSTNPAKTYEYTLAWNHVFSPTTLNEARVAFLRLNAGFNVPQTIINPNSYGFTGINDQQPTLASLPVMAVTGFFTAGFSNNGPQPRVQNTYQATDNFSKVYGHHTFKLGFNMDRIEINNPFYNSLNGGYTYNGSGPWSTSNPGVDFLLGIPDSYSQGSGSIIRGRGREYYSYGQDQWQMKRNLTLTLGLGWDIETPYKNLYANGEVMSAFHPGQQSTVFPTAPAGVVFPGDVGSPYGMLNKNGGPTIHYADLAPRVGFAWSPGGSQNWSIRGGIGLYYNRSEEELTLQTLGNAPFSIESSGAGPAVGSSPGFINPYVSVNPATVGTTASTTAPQVFPFTPPTPGTPVNFSNYFPLGFSWNTEDPRFTSPRSTNYNLTVQRQISKSTIVSLGYVGNVTRHLEGAYDLNPVNPAVALAEGCTSDFTLLTCPNAYQYPTVNYIGAVTPANPLGAIPSATSIGSPGFQTTAFTSNYNSLQASFNRHFSNGMQVLAAYTWSRYFDYTSNLEGNAFDGPGINPENIRSMYGPSANDAPQRFVVSYTYTLPFFKLTHHWKRLTDDWNLVGIYTLQHGLPVAVQNLAFDDLVLSPFNDYYAGPNRASVSGQPLNIGNPRNNTIGGLQNYWFNPAAFMDPGPGVAGNANRNPLYGPGINYSDLALEKSVHIDESRYFQLRLETFNTFNHANFAAPDGNLGDPNFGRVLGVQQLTTNGDGRVLQLAGKFYF